MNNEIPESLRMEGTFDLTLPGYDDDRPGSVVYEGVTADVRDMAERLENPILWEHEHNLVVSGTFLRRRKNHTVITDKVEEIPDSPVLVPVVARAPLINNSESKHRFKTIGMWIISCVFCVLLSRILTMVLH